MNQILRNIALFLTILLTFFCLMIFIQIFTCLPNNPLIPLDRFARCSPEVVIPETPESTATSVEPPIEPSQDPIKIAVIVDTSGNYDWIGKEQEIGIQIAQSYLKDVMIQGRSIELEPFDTRSEERRLKEYFQNAIDGDHVAIIGPTLSTEAISVTKIIQDGNTPVIGVSNTATGLTDTLGENYFRVSASVEEFTGYAIDKALRNNRDIRSVAIAYDSTDKFCQSEYEAMKKNIGTLIGNIDIASIPFKPGDDLNVVANDLSNNKHDLVILSALPNEGVDLIQRLKASEFTGEIIAGNGMNTPTIFDTCKEACIGVIVAQSYNYGYNHNDNEFLKQAYLDKEELGGNPSQFAAQLFAAVQVLVQALDAVDDVNVSTVSLHEALKKQLNEDGFETVLGTIKFTDNRDYIPTVLWSSTVVSNTLGQLEFKMD